MTKRNMAVISGKFELQLRQHMKLHGTGGPGSGVVLSRARAANSLWRKSRIRLGPGAIEPVH